MYKLNEKEIIGIAALLIHAAKIDENFSKWQEEIKKLELELVNPIVPKEVFFMKFLLVLFIYKCLILIFLNETWSP